MPFAERHGVDHPLQFYAATKRANELMAHAYAHLYRLPCTGLRFFTVYGPWGRPDMAPMLFTRAILEDRPIRLYNDGRHSRDFTYVDDVVEGVVRASDQIAAPDPGWDAARARPGDLAARRSASTTSATATPVELGDFVAALEAALGKTATARAAAAAARRRARHLRRLHPRSPPPPATAPPPRSPRGSARFAAWYRDFYGMPAGHR